MPHCRKKQCCIPTSYHRRTPNCYKRKALQEKGEYSSGAIRFEQVRSVGKEYHEKHVHHRADTTATYILKYVCSTVRCVYERLVVLESKLSCIFKSLLFVALQQFGKSHCC